MTAVLVSRNKAPLPGIVNEFENFTKARLRIEKKKRKIFVDFAKSIIGVFSPCSA